MVSLASNNRKLSTELFMLLVSVQCVPIGLMAVSGQNSKIKLIYKNL